MNIPTNHRRFEPAKTNGNAKSSAEHRLKPIASEWDDTLMEYLSASNEDQVVLDIFDHELSNILNRAERPIFWLEIGPGPGSKTLGLAHLLKRRTVPVREARLVEPSAHWTYHLKATGAVHALNDVLGVPVSLSEQTFDAFSGRPENRHVLSRSSSLVTAIHVLYDGASLLAFSKFASDVQTLSYGMPVFYFVVSESADSDFAIIREQLRSRGFQTPQYDAGAVAQILREARPRIFREVSIGTKYCHVHPGAVEDWLAPFILGYQKSCFNALPISQRIEVITTIREYMLSRPDGVLRVPDTVCIACI